MLGLVVARGRVAIIKPHRPGSLMAASSPPWDHPDPFAEVRKHKHDASFRQHNIILSAVEELIIEHRGGVGGSEGQPTPNEYFAALMTGLEAQDQSHTPELISLLHTVLSNIDSKILRAKVGPVTSTLIKILKANIESSMTAFVRDLILCLGLVLVAQEPSSTAWASPTLLKSFGTLLTTFNDRRPKVRKAAYAATVDILTVHARHKCTSLANQVGEFSLGVLAGCTTSDSISTLHLLGFLQEGLCLLTMDKIKKISEMVLRLQALNSSFLVQASSRTLMHLVKAEQASLTPAFLSHLLTGVLDLQPPPRHDKEVNVVFCELVSNCLKRLVGEKGHQEARALVPRVMQCLVGCCESEHGEVHEEACAALRQVLGCCILMDGATSNEPKKKEAYIEDVVTVVRKLLHYRYQQSWTRTIPFLSALFVHFRDRSQLLLGPLLKQLADLYTAIEPMNQATAELIKAVEAMGIEGVMEVLPLSKKSDSSLTDSRAWLLPIMIEKGKRCPSRLRFFHQVVLDLARKCGAVATQDKLPAAQKHRMYVLQLWDLLPAFCSQPTDISTAFRDLALILATGMQDARYPELLAPICQGLQNLVRYVRRDVEDEDKDDDSLSDQGGQEETKAHASPMGGPDYDTLSEYTKKFLPTLFSLLDTASPDEVGKIKAVSDTISIMATIAPPSFVSNLFKKLVKKMLEATKVPEDKDCMDSSSDDGNAKALILCELAVALVPSLDAAGATILYKVVRPLIRLDIDAPLQKRAYRVLAALCQHQARCFLTPDTVTDLITLLTDALLTCHVSARQMRLRVLELIVATFEPGTRRETLAELLGEVLLCLKDANAKAREAAYQLLLQMARACGDLPHFCQMVIAALAGQTAHLRSAAVLGLSRLVFEFNSPDYPAFQELIPDLLATVLFLGEDPAREVAKAVVGFIRVCVAALPPERLDPHLKGVVDCLFHSNSKVRFRAKIKVIIKKLCRKFGYQKILSLAPESDRKLIHHIQKQAERGARISAKLKEQQQGEGMDKGRGGFDDMMASGDEDTDDDDHEEEDGGELHLSRPKGRKGVAAQQGKRKLADMLVLDHAGGGEVVDLLDASMVRHLRLDEGGKPTRRRKREESSDQEDDDDDDSGGEEVGFNAQGKLVIREGNKEEDEGKRVKARLAEIEKELKEDEDDEDLIRAPPKRKKMKGADGKAHEKGQGKGIARDKKKKQQAPGATFKAKKAGGDVQKKGQLEPYAYIPLDPKLLSKKHRHEASRTFDAVVGGAAKGKGGGKQKKGGRR